MGVSSWQKTLDVRRLNIHRAISGLKYARIDSEITKTLMFEG